VARGEEQTEPIRSPGARYRRRCSASCGEISQRRLPFFDFTVSIFPCQTFCSILIAPASSSKFRAGKPHASPHRIPVSARIQ
jgi:hypothetical protein